MVRRISWLAMSVTLGVSAAILPLHGHAAKADVPSADNLKQALERRMMSLKPKELAERNVLFQEVRAGTPEGGRYPFQVSGFVRDYGAGYPANKFYGETCVGRMDKAIYTLSRDSFGEWQVDGRMTLDTQCKKNPSAGASSIPVAALGGSSAPAAAPAPAMSATAQKAPAAGIVKGVRTGSYECWHFTRPRLMLNFTLQTSGRYLDSDNKPGSYAFDPGTGKISFKQGALDGQSPVYHEPRGRPTVSFRNKTGDEVDFCEFAR